MHMKLITIDGSGVHAHVHGGMLAHCATRDGPADQPMVSALPNGVMRAARVILFKRAASTRLVYYV